MIRKLFFVFCALVLFPQSVFAKYDPLSVPNNKYGIHIVDPNDVADAAKLVNSTGGDWGYVTLVIQDDDRDRGKWQRVFNEMRSLRLIPIVRLATHIDGNAWKQPYKDAASDWATFLNALNWPIENRYVAIYNEPNHANEWGRSIDPEEYAHALRVHASALHEASGDFFVLPAGLDVSAASDGQSLDAAVYLTRMLRAEPALFDHLDGWTSHSYPNPEFSGSPYALGRGTLRSFLWERSLLRELGITKSLPVFITETGWVHAEGMTYNSSLLSSERVGVNFALAALGVWRDPTIVAITPFVLNYQGLPFDHFSWRRLQSKDFYPQYGDYQQISKTAGEPLQREKYILDHNIIPDSLVAGSTYVLSSLVKNDGQAVMSEKDGYTVTFVTEPKFFAVHDPLPIMEPGQYGTLTLHIETPNLPGDYPYRVEVRHWGRSVIIESGTLKLVPPPSVTLNVQLGWRTNNDISNATVLVYDNLTLIHKVVGLSLENGKATIRDLRNVMPGQKYRIVVLVPYYLPRQKISELNADTTTISVPRFYPLDFDHDGALSPKDVIALLKLQPHFIRSLFVGQ